MEEFEAVEPVAPTPVIEPVVPPPRPVDMPMPMMAEPQLPIEPPIQPVEPPSRPDDMPAPTMTEPQSVLPEPPASLSEEGFSLRDRAPIEEIKPIEDPNQALSGDIEQASRERGDDMLKVQQDAMRDEASRQADRDVTPEPPGLGDIAEPFASDAPMDSFERSPPEQSMTETPETGPNVDAGDDLSSAPESSGEGVSSPYLAPETGPETSEPLIETPVQDDADAALDPTVVEPAAGVDAGETPPPTAEPDSRDPETTGDPAPAAETPTEIDEPAAPTPDSIRATENGAGSTNEAEVEAPSTSTTEPAGSTEIDEPVAPAPDTQVTESDTGLTNEAEVETPMASTTEPAGTSETEVPSADTLEGDGVSESADTVESAPSAPVTESEAAPTVPTSEVEGNQEEPTGSTVEAEEATPVVPATEEAPEPQAVPSESEAVTEEPARPSDSELLEETSETKAAPVQAEAETEEPVASSGPEASEGTDHKGDTPVAPQAEADATEEAQEPTPNAGAESEENLEDNGAPTDDGGESDAAKTMPPGENTETDQEAEAETIPDSVSDAETEATSEAGTKTTSEVNAETTDEPETTTKPDVETDAETDADVGPEAPTESEQTTEETWDTTSGGENEPAKTDSDGDGTPDKDALDVVEDTQTAGDAATQTRTEELEDQTMELDEKLEDVDDETRTELKEDLEKHTDAIAEEQQEQINEAVENTKIEADKQAELDDQAEKEVLEKDARDKAEEAVADAQADADAKAAELEEDTADQVKNAEEKAGTDRDDVEKEQEKQRLEDLRLAQEKAREDLQKLQTEQAAQQQEQVENDEKRAQTAAAQTEQQSVGSDAAAARKEQENDDRLADQTAEQARLDQVREANADAVRKERDESVDLRDSAGVDALLNRLLKPNDKTQTAEAANAETGPSADAAIGVSLTPGFEGADQPGIQTSAGQPETAPASAGGAVATATPTNDGDENQAPAQSPTGGDGAGDSSPTAGLEIEPTASGQDDRPSFGGDRTPPEATVKQALPQELYNIVEQAVQKADMVPSEDAYEDHSDSQFHMPMTAREAWRERFDLQESSVNAGEFIKMMDDEGGAGEVLVNWALFKELGIDARPFQNFSNQGADGIAFDHDAEKIYLIEAKWSNYGADVAESPGARSEQHRAREWENKELHGDGPWMRCHPEMAGIGAELRKALNKGYDVEGIHVTIGPENPAPPPPWLEKIHEKKDAIKLALREKLDEIPAEPLPSKMEPRLTREQKFQAKGESMGPKEAGFVEKYDLPRERKRPRPDHVDLNTPQKIIIWREKDRSG